VIAASKRPSLARLAPGLPGLGRARLVDLDEKTRRLDKWLLVADAPLDRYGEDAINSRLSDLEWVARSAVAHEAVIESVRGAAAVLPMKLFTIFANDGRARDHIRAERARIDSAIARVANRQEWGVRVVLERARPPATARKAPRSAAGAGKQFLAAKRAQRDAASELASRAREVVADLYDRLAAASTSAKRRAPGELPVEGGPLLLDAAFLVPIDRTTRFRGLVAKQARALARDGYRVSLSGPWPPYGFVQE
jgi:hypothetical protein